MKSWLEGLSVTEEVQEFNRLLQYPEVQKVLYDFILNSLTECNVFLRLNLIEEHLGADDFHCIGQDLKYDGEREPLPNLQVQLQSLMSKSPDPEVNTITDIRAKLLVEKLKKMKYRLDITYLNSKDIKKFLQEDIDEKYRIGRNGNPREIVRRVIDRAVLLYPSEIKRGKNKNGNQILRIELV